MSARDWTSPQRLIDAQFSEWIRAHRTDIGMSQARLGKPVSLSQAQINRIESANRPVSLGEAVLLSRVVGKRLFDFAPDIPTVLMPCPTCDGKPPRGFTCNACGVES